ncbi:DUF1439 domain-containing protein [Luteimonas aestuarii]|nr:DUF1439 domain-containing protein [Luteimonas aestuarii]
MHHRPALVLLAALTTLLAGCTTLGVVSAWLNDRVALAPPQLQRYLDQHYPRSFDRLGGLVTVTLENPRLSIPAGDTRLRLDFDVGVGALGSRNDNGRISLASGLRYDPGTQGLHLDAPELLQFDIPGAGSMQGGARGIVNSLMAELSRNEPVYRLEPDLLSKLPAGRRVGDVAIERGTVVVHLDR